MAAAKGNYEICKYIIKNIKVINPPMVDGITPLYMAAQNGHFDTCKLIIENVEDKNPAENDGTLPFLWLLRKVILKSAN